LTQTQLNFTSEDFSLIARIRVNNLTESRFIFTRGLDRVDGYYFYLHTTGLLRVQTNQALASQITHSTAGDIALATWYTVGFSRNGASIRLYKNGIDITATPAVHIDSLTSARSAKIGIYDDLISAPFDGKIEFLMVYNRALSEAEHLYIHNNHWPQSEDGLVLWLKMEDGSGNTASDSSTYGSDGTLHGVPDWVNGPDERPAGDSGTNDSRITWGVNPTGVAASLSSLVSEDQPGLATPVEEPARDVMPEIETSDWFVEPDIGGSLATNPIRPFVTLISDNTTLTELQVWRWLGIAIVLFVTVTTARLVPKHLAIACFAGGAMTLLMVVMTVWPLWALMLLVLFALGGWVSERSPSV